jgi:predicted O-methyltransferase YrrM
LLHSLVRFHRPQHVVELGYGYTTPFLAQALRDNAVNIAEERKAENAQRQAKILRHMWYLENRDFEDHLRLSVIDDQSQRGGTDSGFADSVEATLRKLQLDQFVQIESSMNLARAHLLFEPNSLGMVWNDAQWDPSFLRTWWPLLKKDGGLLLLHNVIGNGEKSRWCVASPKRVMQELFPGEKFEYLTLLEPHKAYQGSVVLLRRLDPNKAPDKYGYMWGGKKEGRGVRQYSHIMDALDRM